jgi:hypothetical protein
VDARLSVAISAVVEAYATEVAAESDVDAAYAVDDVVAA